MENESSIKKNYIYKLIYQIVTFAIPILTTPYLSRVLGANGVGIHSYTSSVASYFILFSALGTATYGAREIAQKRDNRKELSIVFWEVEFIRIISTSICLIVWLGFSWHANTFSDLYFILAIQVLATAFDITWLYEGVENFKIIVIRNILIKILGIAYLFLFIKDANELNLYILSIGVIALIGNISLWSECKKYIVRVQIEKLNLSKHIKSVFVYFVPTIATSVYTVLDKTMIGFITGLENENGYYEQSERIINIGKSLATTLPAVIAPRAAYLYAMEKKREMQELVDYSIDFTLFLTIPIAVGFIGIANKLIPWYLGAEFEKVIILIYITAPLVVIVGLSGCIGLTYLTPSGQRARSSKAIIIGAGINFVLNYFLIPDLLSKGAAISSVIAELIITGMYIYMSKPVISYFSIAKLCYKKCISAGVMFLVISHKLFQNMNVNWKSSLLQIACGMMAYVFCEVIFRDKSIMLIIDYSRKRFLKD